MGNNWQEVSRTDAVLYCEKSGFRCKEMDPFAMEVTEFFLPNTKIEFKYKMVYSDPVKFYIWPRIDGKDVTIDEFKKAVKGN